MAPFFDLALELPENNSKSVDSGVPKRTGDSSTSSTYSPYHAFSAILRGIGGEHEPINTAPVESSSSELPGGSSTCRSVFDKSVAPLWDVTVTEELFEAVEKIGTFAIRLALGMPPIVSEGADVAVGLGLVPNTLLSTDP